VVPRVNGALGFTLRTPPEDRSLASASDIRGSIAVLLAGRAAEKLAFDEVTTGASDDLQRATRLAEQFVGVWGMSDIVGPRALLPVDSVGSGAVSAPAMGRPGASSRLPSMEQGDHEVRGSFHTPGSWVVRGRPSRGHAGEMLMRAQALSLVTQSRLRPSASYTHTRTHTSTRVAEPCWL
jgi:hypothetical protein